jgi:hypothetical protein
MGFTNNAWLHGFSFVGTLIKPPRVRAADHRSNMRRFSSNRP